MIAGKAGRYDATDTASLMRLRYDLIMLPREQRVRYLAYCIHTGLMRSQWWVNTCFRIAGWWRGQRGIEAMLLRDDRIMEPIEIGTLEHMVTGKDTIDPRSAGGFSQSEIDAIVEEAGL